MKNFDLAEECLGYVTSPDESNTDKRFLVAGSKNVLIDWQKKVKIRPGYFRLGAANTSLTPNTNGWTWGTSTGQKWLQKFYDTNLTVYLSTVDGEEINAWKIIKDDFTSTEKLRVATWFDTTENIDLLVMVNGDDNTYAWSGAIAVVSSVTANAITKKGTTTFGQNRFLATANQTLINVRTGTEFTYTGGESTTTLTGVSGSPVTDGMIAGDILIQKVVTNADSPVASRNNHTVWSHENQIVVGSEDDEEVYVSKNTDYTDFTFSSPREAGEGALLTLTDPTRGIASLGKFLIIGSGNSTIFKVEYTQIAISTTLAETMQIKKLDVGIDQGFLNQESIIPVGNTLIYLTNEVSCRQISNPEELTGISPKTLSNPIKPDFDAEDWYDSGFKPSAFGKWYKNMVIFTAPQGSRMYILNFVEDADGKLFRFWNPPQVLPVGPMSIYDLEDDNGAQLYGHSNAVPETYLLFYGASDGQYDDMAVKDKLPIDAAAAFAYSNDGKRALLKNFDEYYVDGEITPNTDELTLGINYDFDGVTAQIEKIIDGSDEDILEGSVGYNSLAQQSLGTNPLGGLLNPPSNTRKFRVVFEMAKEDYFERQAIFATNDVDRYWAIIAHGCNVGLSKRKPIHIKK